MSTRLLFWAIFCLAIDSLVGQKKGGRYRTPIKFLRNNCTADLDTVTDVVCEFRPSKNKIGIFNYGLTYKKPVDNVLFGIRSYLQTSDHSFQNGHVNIKENACADILKSDSLIFKLLPFFKDVFAHFIRPCPYSGRSEIKNFTLEHFDDTLMRRLVKTGTYKLEFRTINGATDSTIFQTDLLVFYKGNS